MEPAETNTANHLMKIYNNSPILQYLVKLIPCIGPLIDAASRETFTRYNHKKYRVFFDELASGHISITMKLIEQDDFLFCFFRTMRAVQLARRDEKIKFLARLFRQACDDSKLRDADEYEEIISIIEELSFNELAMLAILGRFEKANPMKDNESPVQRTNKYWKTFIQMTSTELMLPEVLIQPMLVRLQRSGCYQEIGGGYFDYTGGLGTLTALYYRVEEICGKITNC